MNGKKPGIHGKDDFVMFKELSPVDIMMVRVPASACVCGGDRGKCTDLFFLLLSLSLLCFLFALVLGLFLLLSL